MKVGGQLQQFKKCLVLFAVGMVCCALSYAIYIVDPKKLVLDYNLNMTPTSKSFTLWKKPPIEVFLKVYIFNITNPTEFMKGEEKLKVQEIGPFVYQELLENHNVGWHDNGTISYTPKRTVLYVPEMSVGNPKNDYVMVPNIPMLGISSSLADAGFFVSYPFAKLTNILDSRSILNMTVYDYLWGYEDSLVRLAGNVVPKFINFQKFGLLDRMYDEGENIVSMNIRRSENMTDEIGRYLSIDTYNGSPGLSHWGYDIEKENTSNAESTNTICNRIRGASEGTLFPRDLDKRAVFRVFRKAFCRPLPVEFKEEVTMDDGLPGYLYSFTDDFLDTPDRNPDNECYCREMTKCLKKGLSDLTPCYYNIPAAISLPHFLDADPSLLEDVEGLHPDSDKHRTKVIIQPTIGIPLRVNSRLQTNLVMQRTSYNSKIIPFNDMTIPLFWTDLVILELPDDIKLLLKLLLQVLPVAQTVLISLLGIVGITTFVLSLVSTLWILNQQEEGENKREDSADLRISLGYGQYTAIRILPAIKKITSKTDLFG